MKYNEYEMNYQKNNILKNVVMVQDRLMWMKYFVHQDVDFVFVGV